MSNFTAEEMKNFTLIFSPFLLKDILPDKDFKLFMMFSEACRELCVRIVSEKQIASAHGKFEKFVDGVEKQYGAERVTPNLHLHLHLQDVALNWGPVYGIWLFALERMNGALGKTATNNRNIEVQLMERISCEVVAKTAHLYDQPLVQGRPDTKLSSSEMDLLQQVNSRGKSLQQSDHGIDMMDQVQFLELAYKNDPPVQGDEQAPLEFCSPPKPACLSGQERIFLADHYSAVTRQKVDPADVISSCTDYCKVKIAGEVFGTERSRQKRSSHVLIPFPVHGAEGDEHMDKFPAVIQRIFRHEFNGRNFIMAQVKWFMPNPAHRHNSFPDTNVEVWRNDFYPDTDQSLVPIHLIAGRFVAAFNFHVGRRAGLNNVHTVVVIPLPRKTYF
jgi:hypothetical protein